MDVRAQTATAVAESIYRDVDAVIVAAVGDRVGEGLTIAAMKRRMHAWSSPDFTDYYLDGQPLVRVFTPTIEEVDGAVKAAVRYQRLSAQPSAASRACAFGA